MDQEILIDSCVMTPTFASGVKLETIDGAVHHIFYVEQRSGSGVMEKVVVARIVMTEAAQRRAANEVADSMRVAINGKLSPVAVRSRKLLV